jgi:histidyl-tRNA synthetase
VFRDEPIGAGRFRQFTQCDADIIGDQTTNADSELLAMISDILKELKIDFEVQTNNRKLLSSIIESVEMKNVPAVMKELDKIEKIGEDNVKTNLRKYADANQIVTLFKLLEKPLLFFIENAFDGAKELQELVDKCKSYGLNVEFNPFLARGLGYYTGNIFEIKENGSTIAGGGRYDKSVGKYLNRDISAVGISFGLERVVSSYKEKVDNPLKIILISIDEDKETIKLSKKLRKTDIPCLVTFGKIGKQMEYANSIGLPFALFIGKNEIQKKKFTLRDLKTGKESSLTELQLIKKLKD